jgi:plastocyanin
MKRNLLFLFFSSLALVGFSKTWTIGNSGFTFSPASQTIQSGDTIKFSIGGSHTVVEVSQATWNNNQNTPLSGGFSLPGGGGTLLPAKLTVGTHWYVCGNHFASGMKGMIIVEQSTATEEPAAGLAMTLSPNPSSGKFQLIWNNTTNANDCKVDVLSLGGQVVYTNKVTIEDLRSQNLEINLADFPKGIYIVRLHDNSGIQSRKLILQ